MLLVLLCEKEAEEERVAVLRKANRQIQTLLASPLTLLAMNQALGGQTN